MVQTEERKKILVAEDNASNYKLIQFILSKSYDIIHAENGKIAVDMYSQHQPDLVLMDISMPVMDGYEATTEIRKLSATVPIIGLTAYAYNTDREKGFKCGMNDYMTKPIVANSLRAAVSKMLSGV